MEDALNIGRMVLLLDFSPLWTFCNACYIDAGSVAILAAQWIF